MHNKLVKKYQAGGGTVGSSSAGAAAQPSVGGMGATSPWAIAGAAANTLGSFLPQQSELSGKYGSLAQGLNTAYDTATDTISQIPGLGTIVGGIMKIGGFLTKGLNALGAGTDGMCVCAGTKVYTSDGEEKNIEDLTQRDGVIGWNTSTQKLRKQQITLTIPKKKECVKLEFSNGVTLECSCDHPIYTKINGEFRFTKADNLTTGSVVAYIPNIKSNKITEIVLQSIKNIGLQVVHNLSALEDQTYLANGIITHNTTQDAILGSPFFALTPWGLLNGIFGQKAETFTKDIDTFAQMGANYGGSESQADLAASKSGKKYGLFSGGARREANRQIREGQRQQATIKDIKDENEIQNKLQFGMNGANQQGYMNKLNGGFRQGLIQAARQGTILFSFEQRDRVQKILRAARGQKLSFNTLNWPKHILKDSTFIQFSSTLPSDFLKNFDENENDEFAEDLEQFYNLWKEQGSPKTYVDANNATIPMFIPDEQGNVYLNSELAPEELVESNENNPELTLVEKEEKPDEVEQELDKKIQQAEAQQTESFQKGGQLNVIPEGALHAHKHHLEEINEDLKGDITHKGIPVVSIKEDGSVEQQAEIERNEIIFNLEVTNQIEELRKKYHEEESPSKKDEIARQAGEILSNSIIEDTDDKTGLLNEVKE